MCVCFDAVSLFLVTPSGRRSPFGRRAAAARPTQASSLVAAPPCHFRRRHEWRLLEAQTCRRRTIIHTHSERALQSLPEDCQSPALASQCPDNTEQDGVGSLSKGKCCNYPKAWNASVVAAAVPDGSQPASPGLDASFLWVNSFFSALPAAWQPARE